LAPAPKTLAPMFDIKWIRDNPEAFDAAMTARGLGPMAAGLLAIDDRRRAAQTALQELQAERNEKSKHIGEIKRKGGEVQSLVAEVGAIKTRLAELETEAREAAAELAERLAELPNIPDADVPRGADESANVELRRWGDKPALNDPRDHVALGEGLGMDFATAARMSGARFVLLRDRMARLARALAQFMLDMHTQEFGYTEIAPPLLVREPALFGTGQLPKFAEDQFQTTEGYWLIPTAEVPLANIAAEAIIAETELPWRFAALTPCFRAEAGAAGKDTRGMIRQHQFDKVELVSITAPADSAAEHERMTECAEAVLQRLGLTYRTMVLATGDLGFAARKTYDIEVWLPGQAAWREISSCSNCGDFQARRMKARCRADGAETKTRFVHTLNGSGVAVGRALIAVLEQYQESGGRVTVPEALRPYLGGTETLEVAA